MSFATLFIGDSQTMTSEAAVLGTPALRMNSFAGRISYLEEEERTYHLTYGYRPDQFDKMMSKIDELLAFQDLKKEWLCRRDYMLKEKTDITGFLLQIINEFPKSIERLKKLPDYYKFINREVE
jgi:predicted glycosyltransferase